MRVLRIAAGTGKGTDFFDGFPGSILADAIIGSVHENQEPMHHVSAYLTGLSTE